MFVCFGLGVFFQVLRRAGSDTFTKQINGKNKVNSDLLWMFFFKNTNNKKRDQKKALCLTDSVDTTGGRHFTVLPWFPTCGLYGTCTDFYSVIHTKAVFNKIFHLPEVVLGSWHCAFWLTSMVYWDIWCSEIYFTCVFLLLRSSWSCPGTGIYLRQTSGTIFN